MSFTYTPTLPTFHLGSGYWANLSRDVAENELASLVVEAEEALDTAGIATPNRSRLTFIVMAAVEARIIFFNAASYEPSTEQLNQFFTGFVIRAVRS